MKKNSEFVGANEEYVPENSNQGENGQYVKKSNKKVLLFYLIPVALFLIIALVMMMRVLNFNDNSNWKIDSIQQQDELLNEVKQQQNELKNKAKQQQDELLNEAQQQQNETISEYEKNSYNAYFEMYQGTKYGIHVKSIIDRVITNNKKETDKIITLKYEDKIITNAEEIKDLKSSFEDSTQYEISLEYNEKGLVYEVLIKNI